MGSRFCKLEKADLSKLTAALFRKLLQHFIRIYVMEEVKVTLYNVSHNVISSYQELNELTKLSEILGVIFIDVKFSVCSLRFARNDIFFKNIREIYVEPCVKVVNYFRKKRL